MGENAESSIYQKEKKIASSIEELPPLREGSVRLIHTTNPDNAEKIVKEGLDYQNQGMIDSTVRAYADPNKIEYYDDDPRFSWRGSRSVIMDVPSEEYRLHRDIAKSPGIVPARHIVGVIDAHRK